MNSLFRKFLWLKQRRRKQEELQEEIQFHLEEEADELQGCGFAPDEAKLRAHQSLGNVTLVRETVREAWGWTRIEHLLQDLRYALRAQRRTPLLTIVIVLSLAIGIGANTAVFSVIDALLLRPLPYPHADRLVAIWLHSPGLGIFRDWPSPGQYLDIKTQNHSFRDISISRLESWILNGSGEPTPVTVMLTSSNLFGILGAKPMLGRLLTSQDDRPDASVAVLTYAAWSRMFGSDPAVLGRSVSLDNKQFTIVGVLPRQFRLTTEVMPAEEPMERVEIFLPFGRTAAQMQARLDENYNLLADLKPGVSVAQAQADINLIANRIRLRDKRDKTFGMTVISLREQVVGDIRKSLFVIFGAVTLVLLSACANVANILLTRAAGRVKEVAIRAALGAGSRRLARQLLTESVLLSMMGGGAGLLLAWGALRTIRLMNPGNIPRLEDITIDGTVLAFTFGLALLTGAAFGMVPVFRAVRVDLNTSLKAGGRRGQSAAGLRVSRRNVRGLLVVAELALAVMLLVGAGLLIRTFVRVQSIPPGFATKNVLTMQVVIWESRYRGHEHDDARAELFRRIEDRIARLPGVVATGVVSSLPLNGSGGWGFINVEGFVPPPGQELQADLRTASADYFRTLQIPLKAGRFFTDHDNIGSQPVAIVDERFAKRFWPRGDAAGKHVWFQPKKPITIVGVVGSVKEYGLDADPKTAVYFSHAQGPSPYMFLAVRTSTDPLQLSNAVVRQMHDVEPSIAVFQIQTMQELLKKSLARREFSATMMGAFGLFGLILAAVGVYGVVSYLVTQGTHEIGVRMAVGTQRGDILQTVCRQGLILAGAGVSLGSVIAAVLARLMSSMLFEVSAHDVVTFTSVTLLLLAITVVATLVPARRAIRIDPISALRDE